MKLVVMVQIGEAVFTEKLFLIKEMLYRIIRKKIQAFLEPLLVSAMFAGIKQAVYSVKKLPMLSIHQLAAGKK